MGTRPLAAPVRAEVLEIAADGPLDEARAAEADVLALHADGALPPLLLIRTWSTEIPMHRALARALGPDQPLYSVRPPSGTEPADYPDTVEAWSDFCLDRLAEVPRAPSVRIGGWSFGGVVALEVAHALARRGERVGLVLMLDSRYPRRHPNTGKGRRKTTRLHRFSRRLAEYVALDTAAHKRAFLRERARRRVHKTRTRLARNLRRLLGRPVPPRHPDPEPDAEGILQMRGRRMTLLEYTVRVTYLKYRLEASSLPVAQLWTAASLEAEQGDASLGWARRLRGELACAPVPGDHYTMFEPEHVDGLARAVARALRQAGVRAG